MKDGEGVNFELVLYAFRDLHKRDPVDGDEVLAWLHQLGLHRIVAWYGEEWEAIKDKPQGLAPELIRNPSIRRSH
jgi:hypothetical protein